jgi:hypothetical protein
MSAWVVPLLAVVIPAVVSVVALYYRESLPRRVGSEIDLRVAEKRFEAYAALWELTQDASPMVDEPLTEGTRARLFHEMTDWYFEGGKGMLLGEDARNIYLKAKANLTCADGDLTPDALAKQVNAGKVDRSTLSKQQLSILRAAIRADIRIFAEPYGPRPEEEHEARARGRAFLEACDIDLTRRPWHDAFA